MILNGDIVYIQLCFCRKPGVTRGFCIGAVFVYGVFGIFLQQAVFGGSANQRVLCRTIRNHKPVFSFIKLRCGIFRCSERIKNGFSARHRFNTVKPQLFYYRLPVCVDCGIFVVYPAAVNLLAAFGLGIPALDIKPFSVDNGMIIKQTHNRSVNLRLHIKCRGAGGSDKAAAVCIKRHRVWIRAFDCVFQRNLRPTHSYGVFCYLTRRRSVRQQYLRILTHAEAFLKLKQNRQRAPGCVFEILCIHIDFFNGVIYHPLKLQYTVVHAVRHRYRLCQLLS